MKFIVYRTSNHRSKPCKNAIKSIVTKLDERELLKTPEEYKIRCYEDWFARGTNHRIINGYIARDMGEVECWEIQINTLEELMELCKECEEKLIVGPSFYNGQIPGIEIYDDYRE